jgi:hypothetical protein
MEGAGVSIYPLRAALGQIFPGLDSAIYEEELAPLAASIEGNDKDNEIIGRVAIRSTIMGLFLYRTADQLKRSGYEEDLASLVNRVRPTAYGDACMELGRYFQERLCNLRVMGEDKIEFTDNDLDNFPQFPEEGISGEASLAIDEFRRRVLDD